jgi:cobalt-precorrin 5A hydrolase
MRNFKFDKIAIWVVTPNGLTLAEKVIANLPGAELFLSVKLASPVPGTSFDRMSAAVSENFKSFSGHIFITAAGIAVRMIAPHLQHKTKDPAVVVIDEQGQYAISLVSGHIGGANALAEQIAGLLGARPVITTATDVSGVPAIDNLAVEKGLVIENSAAIKTVNMAFIRKEKICLYDPAGILTGDIPEDLLTRVDLREGQWPAPADRPGVYISDMLAVIPETVLVLRPKSLAAGIGCNRNTDAAEIRALLLETLKQHHLSADSLKTIASIDIKNDEPGLLALAAELEIPLVFYPKDELNTAMGIENPSAMVETHTGAKSVCEAAAILATGQGSLVVSKKKSKNTTVALARAASI